MIGIRVRRKPRSAHNKFRSSLLHKSFLTKARVVVMEGTKIEANASILTDRTQEHIEKARKTLTKRGMSLYKLRSQMDLVLISCSKLA